MRKPLEETLEDIKGHKGNPKQPRELLVNDEGNPCLPLSDVATAVSVFQPRTLDGQLNVSEDHIVALCKALALGDELDPITVWWSGKKYYVVDGHHRLQAYLRFKPKKGNKTLRLKSVIPVKTFEGSLDDAIAFAASENSKNKLAMTQDDKLSMAWRLVCLTNKVNAEIEAACVVGKRSVTRMRSGLKGLLEELKCHTRETLAELRWWQVRMLLDKREEPVDPDEKLKADIEYMAKRLRREHGTKLAKVPQVFAGAIAMYDESLPRILVSTPQWERLLDGPDGEPEEDF